MKTIDNKFEIGEECYTYARENVEVVVQYVKGQRRFFTMDMRFHVNSVIQRERLYANRQWLHLIKLKLEGLWLVFGMM